MSVGNAKYIERKSERNARHEEDLGASPLRSDADRRLGRGGERRRRSASSPQPVPERRGVPHRHRGRPANGGGRTGRRPPREYRLRASGGRAARVLRF